MGRVQMCRDKHGLESMMPYYGLLTLSVHSVARKCECTNGSLVTFESGGTMGGAAGVAGKRCTLSTALFIPFTTTTTTTTTSSISSSSSEPTRLLRGPTLAPALICGCECGDRGEENGGGGEVGRAAPVAVVAAADTGTDEAREFGLGRCGNACGLEFE